MRITSSADKPYLTYLEGSNPLTRVGWAYLAGAYTVLGVAPFASCLAGTTTALAWVGAGDVDFYLDILSKYLRFYYLILFIRLKMLLRNNK